jgi:hypothetical protein
MYLRFILLISLVFLTLILFLPFRFSFHYVKEGDDEDTIMTVWVFRGLEYKIRIPILKIGKGTDLNELKLWREDELSDTLIKKEKLHINFIDIFRTYKYSTWFLERYQSLAIMLFLFLHGRWPDPAILQRSGRLFLKLIIGAIKMGVRQCERFQWRSEIGLGDAALTGLGLGIVWNVKTFILAKINDNVEFIGLPPSIEVHPYFAGEHFNTSVYCIFKVRIGHIILIGLTNLIKGLFNKIVEDLNEFYKTSSGTR